ncbi:ABC transporter permease [Bdellovibrio reynosensis]|uniref:ABC transporter permease n=1 Tax=Bdellovibrio reynosensis TaxID=2835041 RepID=A0ABY4CC47_9BACT|nr:ABC transporter permease [Bdellovibrio reynosensis]UOF01457.1 ABC transporter permease [Bdellovibrio reynosensis]
MLKALPGGPFDEDFALNPLVKEKLMQHWKVEASGGAQFISYISGLVKGDLGVSMARPDRTVVEIISQGVQNTLFLNCFALLFILVGAFLISLLAIRFQGKVLEQVIDQGVIAFLSLPSLFWGPLLIYLFGFYFNLLPVAFLTTPQHYILPILTLSLRPLASLVRLLKNSLTDNFGHDYVRTARAKGVGTWQILFFHVLKNSMIPFLSYVGPLIVGLLSGSFLVELLFAVPGLGSEFVSALNDRDYTLIMGLTLFYGTLLILVNIFVDVLLKFVDPRLREEV